MLKDSFYYITFLQSTETTLTADLQLNAGHAIFRGHFPNQPVVPGVCLMQMVKEVLEVQINQSLMLIKADFLKFIVPVVPDKTMQLHFQVKYNFTGEGQLKTSATLLADTVVSFKFQGYFRVV